MAAPIAGLNPHSAVWLAAHTAPFKEPSSWGGVLPRIPDGHEMATQVQQIRVQGTIRTDANGGFHFVVPGDPYRNRFPFYTHDMNLQTNDFTGSAYRTPAEPPAYPTYYTAPGRPPATVNGRTAYLVASLARAASSYNTMLPSYVQQLTALVADNAAYRIIGQASRIWSLQGELQPQTGIIRVATLNNTKLNEVTEMRGTIGSTDYYQNEITPTDYNGALVSPTPLPVVNGVFSAGFPCYGTNAPLAGNDAFLGTGFTYNQDSVYGGLMYALGADVANGNAGDPYATVGPATNPLWNTYLKTVSEAAEHAFSYVIFDGRKGATARSAYCSPDIPFRSFRPHTLFNWGSPKGAVSNVGLPNFCGTTNTGGGSFALSIPNPGLQLVGAEGVTNFQGSGMYTFVLGNAVEPLTTGSVLYAAGGPSPGAQLVINANTNVTPPSGSYTSTAQVTAVGGMYDVLQGFADPLDSHDIKVDGYHIQGTQFQPLQTMYLEHVITIETVPNQQQTGLMSMKPIIDMDFKKVLEMASNRTAFPRVAMGHSFWSSFTGAIKKGASAVWSHVKSASNVLSSVASFIPGPIGMGARALGSVTGAFSDNTDGTDGGDW